MNMNRFLLPLSLVVGAVLIAANFPTSPAVVASVDLEKVYRSLDQLKASESRAVTLRSELEKRLATVTDEVRTMQEDLESFQPGSAAHNEAMDRTVLKAGDLSALQTFAKLKLESEQANSVRDAYAAIRATCAMLAKEQKIDFIFIDDTIPVINPTNLEGTMQQINGRRMLYSNPALDITDALIERMNADFRTANPSIVIPSPAPSARTPSTPPTAAGKS
ncbi:MAG: OmpH family outer membrane protein [Phycisphaerales bacterium]|nr:OmpH family outer membrane protein [Phycisphaerales bacterium]